MKLQFLFSAYCLMVLYICIKFCKNISNGFKVIERTQFANLLIQRGIIKKNVDGVMIIILSILPDDSLYLNQFS